MPRKARIAPGGMVFHVLNRANGRLRLFKKDEDFQAFERVLLEAHQRLPIRVLSWCLMPNHWHLILWPRADGELTAFMRWLTLTHAQRWKHAHDAVGHGHLYQGRFKSLPIAQDEHLLTALRYVERNPVRARLVPRAEAWPWGSCSVRREPAHPLRPLLSPWPIDRPPHWLRWVNQPQTAAEAAAYREHLQRNRPYGTPAWTAATAKALRLEASMHPPGRPLGWRKPQKRQDDTANGPRHL
jgi:putative transposase